MTLQAEDTLVGYYPCELGPTIDASTSRIRAIYSGPQPSLVDGPFGGALSCCGAGDQDIFRYGLNLGTDDFTIAFWVRAVDFDSRDFSGSAGRGLVVYGYSPTLLIHLDDKGGMSLEMPEADGAHMRTESIPFRSTWTHLAFVVDRDGDEGCKIYRNGVELHLSSVAMDRSVNTRYDMRSGFMFGRALIGNLDEIRIYRSALTSDEIVQLYSGDSALLDDYKRDVKPLADGWIYGSHEEVGADARALSENYVAGGRGDVDRRDHGRLWTRIAHTGAPSNTHVMEDVGVVRCINQSGDVWAGDSDGEATVWRGSPESAKSISLGLGSVYAMHGDQLVGQSRYGHAMLWTDGTEEGFVDIMVRRAQDSIATGTVGSSQVGWATLGRLRRRQIGVVWHGNAAYGFLPGPGTGNTHGDVRFTCVEGTGKDAAIGAIIRSADGKPRAFLGVGKLDAAPVGPSPNGYNLSDYEEITWIDLNPQGAESSEIVAMSGGRQVGFAVLDGVKHAGIWSGSADSFVDLQPTLEQTGEGWQSSWANAIYDYGDGTGAVLIAGAGKGGGCERLGFVLSNRMVTGDLGYALPEPKWEPPSETPVPPAKRASVDSRPKVNLSITDTLLCYFPLDEAVGRRSPDATGNSRDAVYRGASPGDAAGAASGRLKPEIKSIYSDSFPSLVPGLFGKALRSYGGGFQDVLKRSGLDLGTKDFTISFWVNPTNYNTAFDFGGNKARGCVIRGHAKDGRNRLAILLDDDDKVTLSMPDADVHLTSTNAPRKNRWTHVALVVDRNDASRCAIYFNGTADPLTSVSMWANASSRFNMDGTFLIGQSLIGDVDEFAVYSKALTPEEVRAIFRAAPRTPLQPRTPRLPQKYLGPPIRPPHRPYRIIYNMDSSGHLYGYESLPEKTVAEYLRSTADFLEGTHVDMVSWCDGSAGTVASWDSEVMELTGARIGRVDPFLLQLIKEGYDPPRVIIPAIRKMGVDVYYSFRFNDIHDNLGNHPELLPTFKVEHPEWMLGPGHAYGGRLQLNFAVQEVRDFKFNVIREVFEKHDFDGLEIDFLRGPAFFVPGTEPENAHYLTQLLRRIRKHLKQRGEERGRPIGLLVRVDESLNACRLDGFDVPTWIKEHLVDMIALGSGARDIEVEEFKALTKGSDIRVYACPYSSKPREVYLALATNYLSQGADGIYTFNWGTHYSHVHTPLRYQHGMLGILDDPALMHGENKLFAADTGYPRFQYPHNWMHVVLPLTVTPETPGNVTVMVGEDFSKGPAPHAIELTVTRSGRAAAELAINESIVSNVNETNNRITAGLQPSQLVRGHNRLRFSVATGEITIRKVEIRVSY